MGGESYILGSVPFTGLKASDADTVFAEGTCMEKLPSASRSQSSARVGDTFTLGMILMFSLIFLGPAADPAFSAEVKAEACELSAEQVEALIVQLSHSDYQLREQATDQLKLVSLQHLKLLEHELWNGRLEARLRLLSVLDHIYQERLANWRQDTLLIHFGSRLTGKGTRRGPAYAEHPVRTARINQTGLEFDQLDDLILKLHEQGNASLAQRSREIMNRGKQLRETRAMIAILGWNGKVNARNEQSSNTRFTVVTEDMLIQGLIDTERVDVLLDEEWKGGAGGVQKLRRLNNMASLYLIDGAVLTREERGKIQSAIPNLRIQLRGRARLGIQSTDMFGDATGAGVGIVVPNSSAGKAGIKRGDLIVRLNETKIESFDALVDELANYKPGDTIEIELFRDSGRHVLQVKLYGW